MTKTEQYTDKLKEFFCFIRSSKFDFIENESIPEYFDLCKEIATLEAEMSEQKEVSELQKLMNDIAEWSDKQFGELQRNPGIVYHLESEVKELIERFEQGVVTQEEIDNLKMEFADCMMLLLDSATHAFINANDLLNAVRQKLEINKQRKWGTTNNKGFTEHIRTEQKPVKSAEEKLAIVRAYNYLMEHFEEHYLINETKQEAIEILSSILLEFGSIEFASQTDLREELIKFREWYSFKKLEDKGTLDVPYSMQAVDEYLKTKQ